MEWANWPSQSFNRYLSYPLFSNSFLNFSSFLFYFPLSLFCIQGTNHPLVLISDEKWKLSREFGGKWRLLGYSALSLFFLSIMLSFIFTINKWNCTLTLSGAVLELCLLTDIEDCSLQASLFFSVSLSHTNTHIHNIRCCSWELRYVQWQDGCYLK